MKIRLKKQYAAALVAYTLALVAVLGGFVYKNHQAAVFYKRQTENCYRRAFNGLATGIGELDSALQKCVFSGGGGMEGETLTRVFGAAETAKQALGELPRGDVGLLQTSGFITRTGDYAFALTKKLARGEALSGDEKRNLKKLSETASMLSGNFTELLGEVNDGGFTLGELADVERRAENAGNAAENEIGAASGPFSERVKATEDEFPEMPSLIYDGPFSSHIGGMQPRFLENKPEVSRDEAQKIAEEFIVAGAARGAAVGGQFISAGGALRFDGERVGSLPVYRFSREDSNGGLNIEISKAGGAVVNMYSPRVPGQASVSVGDAVKTAEKFLSDRGFAAMRESYHMTQDGSVTVNFAYTQDDVICYTDLIKVTTDLDTGEVSGFEAQGYIMHHHERELPEPEISADAARAKVSKELNILSQALSVIPTDGKNEAFCYEFKCEAPDGRHYIVYINAETGAEERILILLEDENGTLAL
ncbi:MAG: germination protein YpeB [Oscillospiraceae bacterium]|jgi:germination protein YpeB|nr:germination protein YpeB [Oscillospiraceae bacterium]